MIRYWFEFELNLNDGKAPLGLLMGCGVTAHSYDDALNILRTKVFLKYPMPPIKKTIENIDVSILDSGHILPNILPTNIRGVWFPGGYNY